VLFFFSSLLSILVMTPPGFSACLVFSPLYFMDHVLCLYHFREK
jgi:hypothetical protein